jgi:hypothetical protein
MLIQDGDKPANPFTAFKGFVAPATSSSTNPTASFPTFSAASKLPSLPPSIHRSSVFLIGFCLLYDC